MKYHVATKFLAVFLCAVTLLGALGSAAGIFVLTEMDLYNKTVDQVREEEFRSDGSMVAQELATSYASKTLGGCPEDMIRETNMESYASGYRWFSGRYGEYSYVIKDGEGNVLEGQKPGEEKSYRVSSFPVTGQYRHLVSLTAQPEEVQQETQHGLPEYLGDGFILYDAIPTEGVEVYSIDLSSENSGSAINSVDPVGFLYHNRQGQAVFRSYRPYPMSEDRTFKVNSITFLGQDETVLYRASLEQGVGQVTHDEEGRMLFTSDSTPAGMPTPVCAASFYDENGEEIWQMASDTGIGMFYCDGEGFGVFEAENVTAPPMSLVGVISGVELYGGTGELIYSSTSLDGHTVGSAFQSDDGYFRFVTADPVQVVIQAEPRQAPETQPETVPETVPETAAPEHEDNEETPEATVETAAETTPETTPETTAETVPSSASAAPEETGAPEENAPVETTLPAETEVPVETTLPAETEAPTEAAASTAYGTPTPAEPAEPLEINGKPLSEYEINQMDYYDNEQKMSMRADYVYVPMPDYMVELYVIEGTGRYEAAYVLLEFVRQFRNDLFLILGVSLLLFAILAVYLCCAAGHKPKTAEVHAGGLNCLPLDLYLGLTVGAMCAIAVAGMEGTDYLLRQSLQTGCVYAVAAGFFACLIFVGFCFAFVAQVKTPGGYWYRNSICARCLGLLVKFALWLEKFIATKFFPWMSQLLKTVWKKGVCTVCLFLWRQLKRVSGSVGNLIRRFCGLIPLSWQWLLSGGIMLLLMLIGVNSHSDGLLVLCVLADIALILYGVYCFGVLMKSAKRMGKGDLDTKVEDKLLLGSFREFAGDLNNLADVAVVAAQKQLKSERMKTELITNVSHDIKTPLTSIINYVDLMQKPHTDEEQEMYLEVLSRQSQRLKKLIDDLMEMSKASTGNMTVEVTKVDAVESINQALGEFADKLEKAQLIPVFRHNEESVSMMADGRLVWRVMSNLLSNAVKYAMPGTRLYIDLLTMEGKVVISLKNISRDELNVDADELMERFVRGDDSRNTEGSGLGLNIAKSLMELQKGQLQLLVDGDLFKVTLIFPGV